MRGIAVVLLLGLAVLGATANVESQAWQGPGGSAQRTFASSSVSRLNEYNPKVSTTFRVTCVSREPDCIPQTPRGTCMTSGERWNAVDNDVLHSYATGYSQSGFEGGWVFAPTLLEDGVWFLTTNEKVLRYDQKGFSEVVVESGDADQFFSAAVFTLDASVMFTVTSDFVAPSWDEQANGTTVISAFAVKGTEASALWNVTLPGYFPSRAEMVTPALAADEQTLFMTLIAATGKFYVPVMFAVDVSSDAASPRVQWQSTLDYCERDLQNFDYHLSPPLFAGDMVISNCWSQLSSGLQAFDAASGDAVWQAQPPKFQSSYSSAVGLDGSVLVYNYHDTADQNVVAMVDVAQGKVRSFVELPLESYAMNGAVAVDGNSTAVVAFMSSQSLSVVAIDLAGIDTSGPATLENDRVLSTTVLVQTQLPVSLTLGDVAIQESEVAVAVGNRVVVLVPDLGSKVSPGEGGDGDGGDGESSGEDDDDDDGDDDGDDGNDEKGEKDDGVEITLIILACVAVGYSLLVTGVAGYFGYLLKTKKVYDTV